MPVKSYLAILINVMKSQFVGVRFSNKTLDDIEEFVKDNHIPNPLKRDEIHATVIHTKSPLSNFYPKGKIDPPWIGTAYDCRLWPMGHEDPPTIGVIIKFNSIDLLMRHMFLTTFCGAKSDFPHFLGHISISYDVGKDFTQNNIKTPFNKPIEIASEYFEEGK